MKILNIFDNFTPFEIFLVGTSIVAAISLFFLIKKKIKQRKERKKFDSLLASKEGYNEDYKNFIQEIERVIPDWEKHKLIHSLNREFKKLLIIKD